MVSMHGTVEDLTIVGEERTVTNEGFSASFADEFSIKS
jgi:hypothetical protein